jgi:hypothetical protein
MTNNALKFSTIIRDAALVVLKVRGLGGKRWKRNVAKGARIGPWLQAEYEVIDQVQWKSKGACLYLVSGSDAKIRYVGISRNGLKHRWRTSPAYDAETMRRLPENQLFHSQCWKHIEAETKSDPQARFEVRSIAANPLLKVLESIGPPLSAFTALRDDGESVVAGIERWICNNSSNDLARWNSAMAGGSKS